MNLLFDYHSIYFFQVFLISLTFIGYLLFGIKEKSKEIFFFIAYWFFIVSWSFGWFINFSFFSPILVLQTKIITWSSVFIPYFFTLFAYEFSQNIHLKESKIYAYTMGIVCLLAILILYLSSLGNEIHFSKNAGYFRILPSWSPITPILSVLLSIQYIWCIIVLSRKGRNYNLKLKRTVYFFILAILFQLLLSFSGLLASIKVISDSSRMYIVTNGSILAGLFIVITYFNNSKIPSTFMVKVIGGSLIVIFLIIATVGRLTFFTLEDEYTKRFILKANIIKAYIQKETLTKLPINVAYITYKKNNEDTKRVLYSQTGVYKFPEKEREPLNEKFVSMIDSTRPNKIFLAYNIQKGDFIYQIAIPFKAYRQYVHSIVKRFIALICITTVLMVVIFPFFFYRAITRPLRALLVGIDKVNTGNLEVQVPVYIEDEIGFITRNFNNMINVVKNAKESLEDKVRQRTIELEAEKDKSDKLLLNILPEKVAEELKTSGVVRPIRINSATVMFTDIEGFTKVASNLSPEKLIENLDMIFYQFDEICSRRKIEKLKTIGDSYMCAGGLPIQNSTHPIEVCLVALEMQDFMKNVKEMIWELKKQDFWSMRLGIHTGPVIAGAVGKNKLTYDIWGDTVNIASRIESMGEIGRVNISKDTYELVKDYFDCEYRGRIRIKNRGTIDMYFLNKIKAEYSKDKSGIFPNKKFQSIFFS